MGNNEKDLFRNVILYDNKLREYEIKENLKMKLIQETSIIISILEFDKVTVGQRAMWTIMKRISSEILFYMTRIG